MISSGEGWKTFHSSEQHPSVQVTIVLWIASQSYTTPSLFPFFNPTGFAHGCTNGTLSSLLFTRLKKIDFVKANTGRASIFTFGQQNRDHYNSRKLHYPLPWVEIHDKEKHTKRSLSLERKYTNLIFNLAWCIQFNSIRGRISKIVFYRDMFLSNGYCQ